ncbi:uncharacterized protein LOC128388644 [Panonychus citri]|uniref:uncharacterized protein LOC128388644 n=1 Tax=Panonychus citri TaxID=50023 RepID=UPI002307DE3A|nr:uncharacterized protein LOC128388644 [Panonychus citri]
MIRRHLGLLFGGHLLFHWIPIFFLVSGQTEEEIFTTQRRTGYACEGSSLTLSCGDPYIINLIRANFGRFSISTCNSQGNLEWSVNCKSPESFANIQLNCNRKNSCLLPASSSFFGDPCPGTYKYLEVHYECVPKFQRPPGFSEVVRSPSSSSSSSSLSSSLDSSSLPSSSPSSPSSSFSSSFDDNWSLLPQSSFSQSSPFSLSEQSSNNKPKNQSPPPIIIPTINPYRTSSPQISPSPPLSPKIELISEFSPSPPPSQPQPPIDFDLSTRSILDIDSKYDENSSRIYEENLYIPPPSGSSSGQLYYSNLENEGTIRILLILGSTLNSIILLIALVTLVLIRSLQTKESALIRKNVTINLLLDHLVLLLILGTYLSPNYFNTTSISSSSSSSSSSNSLTTNTSTLRSLGFLVALYHYFLLVHFVWILFDLDLELHVRLSRKQFIDPSLVLGPSGTVSASVNISSTATTTTPTTATTASILTGGINPVKLRRYLYLTSYLIPLIVILLISWSTSTQALPMFANLCSLEARSHLASFVIASSIILTGLGLVLLLVTYSRIGLHTSSSSTGQSSSSPVSPGSVGGFVYPSGLMTSADKFALDLMLNRKLKISLFCRFSLNLLAAINCTLGVVYLTYRVSTIGFLFALTNVSLGLFVFSYYCLTKENIRSRYSLICSYAARHIFCLKGDSKSYLDNPHPVHHGHHHSHHPNVVHHLPLNSGLNGGLSRGFVFGGYNKNPSIQNLTGNPAQLSQPMIGNSSSMGGLSREFSSSRHYLASDAATTESGSDYGCRRLTPAAVAAAAAAAAAGNGPNMATHGPTPNHFYHLYNPKQSCNPYSCHHMIEHVYECIDDEPYVAKVILPPGSTVASAALGNYRLHSMAAAAAAAAAAGGDHGHHLHQLHHFQQTLPNHYLGYHNLESLHLRNGQFAVSTGAPTSSGLTTTTNPSTTTQGTPVTCSNGLIGNTLPAIVSDNSGRRTIICSKSSSNLAHEGDLTNGSNNSTNLGTFNGNNDINNHSLGINNGAPVLAVLGSNNRVISSFTNSHLQQQQQGINI